MRLYIAVLTDVDDFIVPTLVAHAMLGAHLHFIADTEINDLFDLEHSENLKNYKHWLSNSFKKCVLRVNQREFDKIAALPAVYLGHENSTLEGRKACAVVCPRTEIPNVLKFAKLWKPKYEAASTSTV